MNHIKFNHTDLTVSPLGLGTVNYGTSIDKLAAKRQINEFLELGGNFLDTAHVYGDWVPGEKGRSERVIGEWIKGNGSRDKIIISTKGAHPKLATMDISRLSAADITKDTHESLERLKTDYIDLYLLHRDDPNMPVAEIIETLEELKKQGKIRYYGCSNWTLSRIQEAQEYAKQKGITGFVCNQTLFSLADVNAHNVADKTLVVLDKETYEYHEKSKMNLMAYMSIAKGYFTHKLQGRALSDAVKGRYDNPTNDAIYNRLIEISKQTNLTLLDLSLKYVMMQNFPSVPLVSFSNETQLKEAMASCTKKVGQDIIDELGALKIFVTDVGRE